MTMRIALLATMLLSLTDLSAAQEPEPEAKPKERVIVIPPNGTEFFRDLLQSAGFQPLTAPNLIQEDPARCVLVIFGSTRFIEERFEGVQFFLRSGGKLLICSDRRSGPGLVRLLNITITGTKIQAKEAGDSYLDDPDLPLLQPRFQGDWQRDPNSPGKAFLDRAFLPNEQGAPGQVATNVPTTLRHGPPYFSHSIEAYAGFPKSARFRIDRLQYDPNEDFSALGGRLGSGQYLVLSDTEIFSNAMMIQPTQNRELASSLVAWLREGREPRTQCLVIEENQIQSRFDMISGGEIPWHVQVNYFLDQHANKLIYELESKDAFNKMILGSNRERLRFAIRGILFGMLIAAILYGFRWMWSRRHRVDHSIRDAGAVIARIPAGGAIQQRHEALLESGNLYDAFRLRIRERFDAIGGRPDETGRSPRIEVDSSIPDGRGIRRRVLDLWDVAYGGKTVLIKATDWEAANDRLRRVLQDALDGRWRFEPVLSTT